MSPTDRTDEPRTPCQLSPGKQSAPAPDSNNVLVGALDEIYDKGAVRRYWHGEETGG